MTKKVGRTSAAAKEMALVAEKTALTTLVKEKRLAPPAILSDAEREEWLAIVNDHPANAFTETHAPLLEAYCRHVVRGRIIAEEISEFDLKWLKNPPGTPGEGGPSESGLKAYDRLLGMHERETRAASSLATRMRITRQAIHQLTVARKGAAGAGNRPRKPWEVPDDGEE